MKRDHLARELREAQAFIQAVLDNSDDGFIVIDKIGTVRSYNKACEAMFGYEPEEVIGENVKMLMPYPYKLEHDQYLSNYETTGEQKVIGSGREVEVQTKSGAVFPLDLTVSEVDVQGETLYVGIVRDISSAQETAHRLAAILDHTVDGLITINQLGEIETFNKACEQMFGYDASEVLGKNVKMLMPAPYHHEHDGYLNHYHITGEKRVIGQGREVEGKRKDGGTFPIDLSVSEVNVGDKVIYSGIVRDLTHVRETEGRLQTIMDNAVDGIITINEHGQVETYNQACEVIFGFTANEVIGQNVKILMPEPYHGEHDEYLGNYHRTGEKKIIGIGREVEGRRKDGSTFPIDLSVSQVTVQGRILYSGIVREVSERKAAEDKLRSANAELEEFAYRTSHDLRSPLASSLGLLKIVDKNIHDQKPSVALRALTQVQGSLQDLDQRVDDILTLTKAKYGQEESRAVDVAAVVETCLEKFGHMENFENLDIQTSFCGQDLVETKASRFSLILENLISNAIKYQKLEGPQAFVRVTTQLDGQGRYVVEVLDNGIGIPEDQREHLFSMFKRFHPQVSFGSGLGHYMVKKSAEMIGAEIEYDAQGEGSLFRLVLPGDAIIRSIA